MTFHSIADRVYPDTQHTRKPAPYLALYEDLFAPLRDQPISLLELGVHSGHSLLLWHEFFPHAQIVGLDMRAAPANIPSTRVTYVQGRQEDPGALARAARAGGPFDLIVDDASHIGRLTKASFHALFTAHLKSGGIYVLEDIAASARFPDWPDYRAMKDPVDDGDHLPSYDTGMIGFLKQLADQVATGRGDIASIEIRPSIAVIRKR